MPSAYDLFKIDKMSSANVLNGFFSIVKFLLILLIWVFKLFFQCVKKYLFYLFC